MPRPSKPPESSRTKLLQVRLVNDEYDLFKAAAENSKLDLSVWVRRKLRLAADDAFEQGVIELMGQKKITLGIRVTVKEMFWAALSGSTTTPILEDSGRIRLPSDTELPEQLHAVRTQLLSIVQEFKPGNVSIRLQETFLRSKPSPKTMASMLNRARVEGTIMQTLFEEGVHVWTGGLQALKGEMGASHSLKEYLSAPDLRGIDLTTMKPEMKEAVVAGIALMET